MNFLFLAISIVGILIFLGICVLLSKDKKSISWLQVGIFLAIDLLLAWFFICVPAGQAAVKAVAQGFGALTTAASEGVTFAFGQSLTSLVSIDPQSGQFTQTACWCMSAILPVIVIVPLFDIFTYFGILPFIIRWVGRGLSFITRAPKFECFYSIEMMFLGNTEAILASRYLVVELNKERCLTVAMMSMSCVTAALIASYCNMMPGQFVVAAIPLNVVNALFVAQVINPVKVPRETDEIPNLYKEGQEREAFFSYLGNSIFNTGKLCFIIVSTVIAFVGLVAIANLFLSIIPTQGFQITLQWLLGWVMLPVALLFGLPFDQALELAQQMGTKIITNEFVVMGSMKDTIGQMPQHFQCVATVFMTSFCNLSTLGMVLGCMKGLVSKEKGDHIAKNIFMMLIAGILVSCLSAGIAGLFCW